jgi:hypothetical protein
MGPVLLEGVTSEMAIAQEEIFGPVLCLASTENLADPSNYSTRPLRMRRRGGVVLQAYVRHLRGRRPWGRQ